MAKGIITRISTLALLGACLTGCSALTQLFHGKGTQPTLVARGNATPTAVDLTSNPKPSTGASTQIARLDERAGTGDIGADTNDLWDRVRAGFRMSAADRPEVAAEIEFFTRHQQFIERTTERAKPYLHHIVDAIERRQMPMEIALLPIVESGFLPAARSRRGAVGVWQFMPGTAREFGLTRDKWYDGRRDVIASTDAALQYLKQLHDSFDGDWLNAIAAYNCGERNVRRAIEENRAAGRSTDFWSLELPSETRIYVPRLLALSAIVVSPLRYDVKLPPVANEPYLAVVDVSRQIDLGKAAARSGVDAGELRVLNPGYLRGVTTPKGIHKVTVPAGKSEVFRNVLVAHIAELVPDARARTNARDDATDSREHRVQSGENLGAIANRYDVTIEAIRELNDVEPRRLRIGQVLLIPTVTDSGTETADKSREAVAIAPEANAVTASVATAGRRVVHTVQAGESLWTIARSYDVHISDVVAWNSGVTPKSVLRLNQKLVVWTERDTDLVAQADGFIRTAAELPGDGSFRLVRYEVQTGDSLWTIAQRYRVQVEQLRLWNGIEEHAVLKPGESIDVYVVSADTASDAARI